MQFVYTYPVRLLSSVISSVACMILQSAGTLFAQLHTAQCQCMADRQLSEKHQGAYRTRCVPDLVVSESASAISCKLAFKS
jgi:hypothetical protein